MRSLLGITRSAFRQAWPTLCEISHPDRESLPGIAVWTMALIFYPWRDRPTGRNPNNSPSMRCAITPVAADRGMVRVGRVEHDRG